MKEIVNVVKKVSPNRYLVRNGLGITQIINTDRKLSKGVSVLLKNGVVSAVAQAVESEIVEV